MDCCNWEFFESEVESDSFTVVDCGPLFGPVTSFTISRDEALNLVLETISADDSISNAPERPAGSVYVSTAQVKLEGRFGSMTTANGVIPRSHTRTSRASVASSQTREISSIHSLHWVRQEKNEPCYLMEWVENLSGPFIWPHFDDVTETGERRRRLHGSDVEIVLSSSISTGSMGRSCVHIVIDNIELFVGVSKAKPRHVINPGFILYKGVPDEKTRSKIRDCLSFCLGNFLVYLGDTTFDAEWHPVEFSARSGHALVRESSKLNGAQPGPLGMQWEFEVTAEELSRMATSLYRIYDTYKLGSIFWAYWHALAAPVHMAAAHFGASIEALQKAFFNIPGSKISNKIIDDDSIWEELCKSFLDCILEKNLLEGERNILSNKVRNLNQAPQGVVMKRFFTELGLELGALESSVWKNRNRAAHGGGADEENAAQLIRENKVLRIMINRILLALGGGGDLYYDYYNLGRPIIRLSDAVRDDRRDK